MQRAPLALTALGLLDLALLTASQQLSFHSLHVLSSAWVLMASLALVLVVGPHLRATPLPSQPRASVDGAGLLIVVGAVLLPAPYLVALCAGIWFVNGRALPLARRVGNALLELGAALVSSIAFHGLAGPGAQGDLPRLSVACLVAGLLPSITSAVVVCLLIRFVDGIPFSQQPIWQPQHYARAQAFDLLGALAAFLLLVSPWSLLFLGGPQLLLVGLLLKDAGSSAAADQDAKTGLLNHPAFVARARAELGRAARHGDPVSLLVLDLDHLREINNRLGHPVGDLAIAAVADVLRGTLRAHDLAARLGGEEFLVLLPCTDLQGAMEVAERIRGSLSATPVPARVGPVVVTASVGVARVEAGEAWESLYERADQALLSAKRAGRDRVEPARAMVLE